MIAHHGFLNNKIHVQIEGDHDGRDLKMGLQTVNTINPNSQFNTITFSTFEAKDYRINILVGLQRFIKQVKDLQEISWK